MTIVSGFRVALALAASALALSACATAPGGIAGDAAVSAPSAPTKPVFVTEQLMAKSAGEVDELLGPPALVRREGAGEFRRYALARCALIAILYPDESGAVNVRQLDVASLVSDEKAPALEDCLAGGPAPAPATS